jgi:Zn-dependent protease with chaperone function
MSRILSTRAALATLFSIAFYAGAISLTIVLTLEYASQWQEPDGRPWRPKNIAYGICALIIPWTIWPRRERFEAPGPQLEPERHPALFSMLNDVAAATGQKMPARVFLMPECNAWVHEVDVNAEGRQQVMAIGLPLFMLLPAASLRAIIAHEFGHYHGGDTKDASRFYRIDSSLVNTFNRVRYLNGGVAFPFLVFLVIFRAVTGRLSRLQEFAADRLAASTESPDALARGLMELAAERGALSDFWEFQILPAIELGYRPPVVAGFMHASNVGRADRQAARSLVKSLRVRRAKSDDSHPPLRARLTALGVEPAAIEWGTGNGCTELLGPLEQIEQGFLEFRSAAALEPITWAATGPVVELYHATKHVAERGKRLKALRPKDLETPKRLVERLRPHFRLHERFESGSLFAAALTVSLSERGWCISSEPGEPVSATSNGVTVTPFLTVDRCVRGKGSLDEWNRLIIGCEARTTDFGGVYKGARTQMQLREKH